MSRKVDRVIGHLQTLGLSQYEARLYVGLLRRGEQNGNELSKTTGVPSSKVYATLERLAALGIARQAHHAGGTLYSAVGGDELVAILRQKFLPPLEYLESSLSDLDERGPEPETTTVSGLEGIYAHARRLISEASGELYLSAWDDDLEAIRESLVEADERGIRIFAMLYGARASLEVGSSKLHGFQDVVSGRIGGRMLTLVADGRQALIAHLPLDASATGVLTSNPVLCLVAEEYLRHDLVFQETRDMIGNDQLEELDQSDPSLRSVILGTALRDAIAPSGR